MDRLQKKCFIVTATTHGLLVGVLLFGAALMPARDDENNVKLLTAYDPSKIVDELSKGGDPNVKPPEAPLTPKPADPTPPPVKPEPPVTKPPPKVEQPEIKPEKVEPPKVTPPKNDIPKITEEKPKNPRLRPEDLTPVTPQKHHDIKPDLTKVKRKLDEKEKAARDAAKAAQEAADAAARAARHRAAQDFASVLKTLGHNLSSKTLVAMSPGPGGGGEVSASYRDVIASKYYNAWVVPTSLDEDAPNVVAKVTISRNGDVVSARIIRRSGNSAMDRSVESALETVTFIEPFPEGSNEQERTVTIQFNLQAKRQIG